MEEPPAVPRLARVLAQEPALKGRSASDAVAVASNSNDVWRIGSLYVRVCWRGNRARLAKEAVVGASLPAEIPYPPVVAVGDDEGLSWMVTEAVVGENLALVWPAMSERGRRRAIESCAAALRVLHTWTPPAAVTDAVAAGRDDATADADEIVGTDIYPLPVHRALALVDRAATLPFVESSLVEATRSRLHRLDAVDPYATGEPLGVVHCDFSLANVLWGRRGLAYVLDFEWARTGPADMDLLWLANDPRPEPGGVSPIPSWLFAAYPEAFAHPRLEERLWLYELTAHLRALNIWPPRTAEAAARPGSFISGVRHDAESPPDGVTALIRARDGG